ncbi:MAG: FHA domain-containing protein [Alcanivoracaceae bacterium]|nr:FHA domain-containing protein [Alcanivoracaceae bacterium]
MHSQDDDKTILGGITLNLSYSVMSTEGSKYSIENETTVGRGQDCDIFIDDKKISRKHALLKLNNGRLQVIDLKSSNGTYINGNKISIPTNLANGDVINFDKHLFTVQIEMKESQKKSQVEKVKKVDIEHTAIADLTEEDFNKINQAVDNFESNQQQEEPEPAITQDKSEEKNIPASWIEESSPIDGTRVMGIKELKSLNESVKPVVKSTATTTQLHCFIGGKNEEIIELPVTDNNQMLGWELGRDAQCDIVLDHGSVSNRHAQIIHQNGRWKIVNLVSTNGILINGQKKLSTYLADGDKISLGSVNLIFKTPKSVRSHVKYAAQKTGQKTRKGLIIPIALGLILAVLAFLIYFNVK